MLPLNRVAIVTGANHGIGAATAIALARSGADIVATFYREPENVRSDSSGDYERQRAADGALVATTIREADQRCVLAEVDLTEGSAPSVLFDRAEAELGPVNVLVHNASGWSKDSFAAHGTDAVGRENNEMTSATIDRQYQVDARAGALLMHEFITRHRNRSADWGRIVTLTSGEGRGFPGEVSYGAAKAALISYTFSAASEMAADGVTANVIYPPVTDTGWITDQVRSFVASDPDHHHIADPAEVAATIDWLCTDAGRLVTGNLIRLR